MRTHTASSPISSALTRGRVVIALPNRDRIRSWAGRLRAAGLGRPVVTGTEHFECRGGPFVAVTSLHWLDHFQPGLADVVILPDASPLLGVDARPPDLNDPHPPRDYRFIRHWFVPTFGFLHRTVPLPAGTERRLWAFFAQTLEAGGRTTARVRVVSVVPPRPQTFVPDPAVDPLGYKRAAVWANCRRNKLIARVADGLSSGDTAVLAGFGIALPMTAGERRVAVLVENSGHTQNLAGILAGWDVRLVGSDTAGRLDRVIVTEAWADRAGRLDVDVLVDARGWGPITLPGFPPPAEQADRTVVLVDIADRAPRPAVIRTRQRLREYADRGWDLVGMTP
ncbi:MAG: hypothetical protein JWO38_6904 [Gemmataceae bacterium]|nr:hypothetical protein [Gemmataceae bacterium]